MQVHCMCSDRPPRLAPPRKGSTRPRHASPCNQETAAHPLYLLIRNSHFPSNTMQPRSAALAGVALCALAALAALQGVSSQMHTQVETLDDSCDAQLDALWQAYAAPPVAPVAGCDEACLQACGTTLNWAVYSEKVQNCPVQEDIIRCFHVYRAQWLKFVNQCALFQYGVAASAGGEGEGGGSSSSSSPSSAAEGSAAAEGAAPAAEGAAPAAEGSAEASPAPAGLGRRRVLLQEAEAALGGVDVSNGCFPTFDSFEEFEEYLNGEYVFATDSSAVGFTLSALYFSSLLLLGIGLPAWAKPWKKIKWGKRKATQLPAPTAPQTPAQEAVEGAAQAEQPTAPAAPAAAS
ncbi:hypothetical protein ABPG75_008111 [Micractinium tetrahymenae]